MAVATVPSLAVLLQKATLDDHTELLRAANNSLGKSKTDLQAQNVKAVALLKLDRFDDALRAFEEGGERLKESAKLEYAYALYKAGDLSEAAKLASTTDNRGMKHVLAQASYRLEDFTQASMLYRDLSSHNQGADNDADLRINSLAVNAQLEWAGIGQQTESKPLREDLDAFETAYNAACGCIARGDLDQAGILLKRARDLCDTLDDMSEDDKLVEILPIMVQQVYVLTRQGRPEEAEQLLVNLLMSKIPDLSTRQVAQVNSLAADTKRINPYLSHRIFHSSSKPSKNDTLFTYQSSRLVQNAHTIDLLSLKYTGVSNSTSIFLASQTSSPTSPAIAPISVLYAAAQAQSQTSKAAIKSLLPLLEKRPRDAGLLLTVVHLYLLTNNYGSAIVLFESFFKRLEQAGSAADLDIRFAPGLIAAAVALYEQQGRKTHVKQDLAKAAKYWRSRQKEDIRLSTELSRAAGVALLEEQKQDDLKDAADIFHDLISEYPNDEAAKAGLIAAYAKLSPEKITEEHLSFVPPAQRMVLDLNKVADELEAGGVPTAASIVPSSIAVKRKIAPSQHLASKKKIRKSRMPKDFIEGKDMDKERWLPMRDRSYYRPKKRKGKGRADGGGLTQGGVVAEEKGAGNGTEVKPAPSGSGGNAGQGKKKKGKGKGGKW